MKELIDELLEVVKQAVSTAGYDVSLSFVKISDRPDLSEYQCNTALPSAKQFKEKPMDIANKIAACMQESNKIQNITVAAPGFINFDVSDSYLAAYLKNMKEDKHLGLKTEEAMTIVMDYGGPNVAKALHIGHLRSAIIGEALKRIAKALGHKVIADVHLGDYGLQMGLIITELKRLKPDLPYFKEDFDEIKYEAEIKEPPFTIEELGNIYPKASQKSKEDEAYYTEALQATKLLQEDYPPYLAIFRHIIKVSVNDLKKSYSRLNVDFDLWLGESDAKPYISDMIQEMKEKGFARFDEKALVVDVGEETDKKEIPPCLVQKSDGSSLYATTDLATMIQRRKDFDMDRIIYVVDKRQDLHFTQVFRAAKKCGILKQETELDFVGFGTICGADGKPLKSRDGGVMTLKSLLDETAATMKEKIVQNNGLEEERADTTAEMVAMAAIKYADLSNQPSKDYIFDPAKFTSYEGNTGPYILYSLVRINSILDKLDNRLLTEFELNEEPKAVEKKLMGVLARYSSVVKNAFHDLAPNKICSFLYEVSELFNKFYHDIRVLSETDEKTKKGYVSLLLITGEVLRSGLELLAIHAPDRM